MCVLLTEVYPAGEAPIVAADGRALARALRVAGKVEPVFVEDVADIPATIRAVARDDDVVLTMGAGSIGQVAPSACGVDMMMTEPLQFTGLRGTLSRDESLAQAHELALRRQRGTRLRSRRPRRSRGVRAPTARPAMPLMAIGLGSNVLVRDGGVRGAVVLLHNPGGALAVADGLIYAEAGVASPKLARFAAMHGCAEAEFLAGVPGTVGGALAMNAGCYGGETWRHVARVEVLLRDGSFAVRTPADYAIGYRSVRLASGAALDGVFTAAWFRFPQGDATQARARIKELLAKRIATQPLNLPNAGSVFRNPAGDHAARLIEQCGLKGYAIGGARVSEKHANFIVNPEGEAKAADIEALIEHVRGRVVPDAHRRGLEPEVAHCRGARAVSEFGKVAVSDGRPQLRSARSRFCRATRCWRR